MKDRVEILFATLVAMQRTENKIAVATGGVEETDHLTKGLVSLQGKYDTIFDSLDEDTKAHVNLVNLDGDANTLDLMRSFDLTKGEMPEFIEDEVIRKAIKSEGHDYDDIIKGRLNTANLTPVRREVRTADGRVYLKTVWVKKEEMSQATQRGRKFLAQHELEKTMRPGDKIKARFLGWSSGQEYLSDKLEIKSIDKAKGYIVAKFTEDAYAVKVGGGMGTYKYGPSASHAQGKEIKIPLTTSKEWNEKTSFEAKPIPAGPRTINNITEISVGDKVLTKDGGETKEVEVKYIHPNGDFIKVRTSDGRDLRRTLNKIKLPGGSAETKEGKRLSDKIIKKLRRDGVSINLGENPTPSDVRKMEAFNSLFPGYDLDEWVADTKKVVNETISTSAADNTNFIISINDDGTFGITVRKDSGAGGSFKMNRTFSKMPNGRTSVYHALFTMSTNLQGSGLGKKMFKALYKQYRNSNIAQIKVSANIDVGGYAWGQYGFTANKSTAEEMARRFTAGKRSPKVPGYQISSTDRITAQERMRDFYRENPATTRFPMHLLCTIGPNHKAGKIAMLGTSWGGEIDLTNPEQKAHFENYIGMSGT